MSSVQPCADLPAEGTTVENRVAPRKREVFRNRSIEELGNVIGILANFIWTKNLRPGEHLWSIPADQERDWDFILSDGIAELQELREENAKLQTEITELKTTLSTFYPTLGV